MIEFEDGVPEGPALDTFPLQSAEGREAFLRRLVDFGEPGVFAAVAHVWSSLARPAGVRCTQMGFTAGTGGSGKKALHKVLTAYVNEWLGNELPPLPPKAAFATLEAWNCAAMGVFSSENEREIATVKKYAAILNGDVPDQAPSTAMESNVLKGPWRKPVPRIL